MVAVSAYESPPAARESVAPQPRTLVITPTYDERDNLPRFVREVNERAPFADVLVVDDASPDGTGVVADALAARDPRVRVLHRKGKEGLGAAYLAGFHWGLERGYDVLCEHDADGSHRPEDLPRLLSALPAADLVIGSRWVKGGKVVNWPASRELLSRAGSLWSRLMLGLSTRDVTGGFRAFRRATLENIGLDEVASAGYCFQVDLLWRTARKGFRVVEVPITFVERERGASKMSQSIVIEALIRTTLWGVGYRAQQLAALGRGARARTAQLR